MSGLTGMPPPQKQDPFEVVVIDSEVEAKLPHGCKIKGAWPHGASFWTRTARIDVDLADGTPHVFFLKVATGDLGLGMVRGEFEGVTKLYEFIPEGVPRPVAWGTYKDQPDTHFYLCDFLDMIEDLPDVQRFAALLAKLHKDSMQQSPGTFGFHEVTYEGQMYQDVTPCESWEKSFALQMRAYLDQEIVVHGHHKDHATLFPALFEKVIPRLLRPLQSHGRFIKPALIHGDIWYGNIATNADTGEPLMFDPSVLWGHNECDLANMSIPRYRMGQHWTREYHKHLSMSAPEEDFDDRITLYEIRSHLVASTLYPDTAIFRNLQVLDTIARNLLTTTRVLDEIRKLVEKYPEGYQGE